MLIEIEGLYKQLTGKELGDNLQILRPTVYGMLIASACKERQSSHGSILIGLAIAGVGIRKSESALGILPESIGSIIDGLSNAINNDLLRNAEASNQQLLPLVLSVLCTVAVGGMTLLLEHHGGSLLSADLMMRIMVKSKFFYTIGKEVAKAVGANEENIEAIGGLINTLLIGMMLMTVVGQREKASSSFVNSLLPLLKEEIGALEICDKKLSTINVEASVLLKQMIIAIITSNASAFLKTLEAIETYIKTNPQTPSLQAEMRDCKNFVKTFWHHVSSDELNKLNTGTGIVQMQG